MKITIKMILVITMISTISYGQNMWLRGKIDLGSLHMMSNLSVDSIKQIIVTDDIESQNLLYPAAVKYLYYIQSAAEFLLDNLNSEIDTSLSVSENSAYWYKVYTNIFFRGLLGDNTAVEKMKIIANHATYLPRLLAIRALAEIGIYDNYSFVIAGYNDSPELFINLLAWYGNDSRYKEEVKSIIMNKVLSSNTTSEVIMLAYDLNVFSNEGTILLNTYFENNSGEERYDYFFELGIIDKDGQPERSIFALQDETNDTMRAKYLPNPFEVLNYGFESKRYLEPGFINALKQVSISDTNSQTNRSKKHFLLAFVPVPPDSTKLTLDLLDNLKNYVDSVSSYTWLGDLQFKDELQSILFSAKTNLQNGDSLACAVQVKTFQDEVDFVYKDSLNADSRFVTIEGWKFLYWNAQYILDRLPELPTTEGINTYSVFATHGIWIEQNSEIISGHIGVNEIGLPPFMDSDVEMSIGISTETPASYKVKANRIKVKQSATVNSDVYYNELENNGTITGSLNTPLELPLFAALPEFHTSTPGTENIVVPQNGEYTLTPGAYGDIQVKLNGKLIFTGGEYHINKLTAGDDNQLLFQSEAEVRIKDKFDSGQGTYIGPQDTTTLSADEIVFYIEGINGTNGNLGATPKAAKIGISNTVKANFYVPNGTLWIRQNSEVEGAFIGKDVDVGIGVKVKLSSAF